MWLRVADIDFDAPRVHVEVAPDETGDCFVRLDAFVRRCAAEGFPDVQLHCRKGTSRRNVRRLREFAAMKRLAPPSGRPPVPGAGATHPCPRLPSRAAGATGDENCHQLRIRGTEHAVDYVNSAVALIGTSLDLDARSMLQLRLCVYELAANTVEHGRFTDAAKEIRLQLEFSGGRVYVSYCDNAESFPTTSSQQGGLVEKLISTSGKRGIGLFMINRLSSDFEYRRDGDWNVSTFSLDVNQEHASIHER